MLRINFVTYKECLYKECHGTPQRLGYYLVILTWWLMLCLYITTLSQKSKENHSKHNRWLTPLPPPLHTQYSVAIVYEDDTAFLSKIFSVVGIMADRQPNPQSTHRVAIANFWRTFTFHHDGTISPAWWGGGVHSHPLSLYSVYLPTRTKLWCSLQLRVQITEYIFLLEMKQC